MSSPSALHAPMRASHASSRPQAAEQALAPLKAGGVSRRMLLVFAASIVAQYGLDVLAVGPHGQMLAIRLVWALGLVIGALLIDEASQSMVRRSIAVQSVLASLCFLALVHVSGGSESPYFELYPFLPLLMALIYPQDSRSTFISGAVTIAGIMGLLRLEGAPPSRWFLWGGVTATVTLLGAYGSNQFRKAQRAESAAQMERERRESLERLAISERRRAQSEKLATIGQLAASVMHEINNPLAFIQANVDFLKQEVLAESPLSREALAEVITETQAGIERVRQIVADLKGFSRMDDEKPVECSLVDVVNDAVRIARLRLKHVARLEIEVPADLPPVLAVRRRLAQVLLNLLVNAGDAMEEHGRPDSQVRIIGRRQGARVLLCVEDNGPGFPPHVLPHLFETFFTTKNPERGTGLGLALSRELVEQAGGSLVAENREEGGARLRLEMPCVGRLAGPQALPPSEVRGT
jgi:signal transduction histidine kinase